MRSVQKQLLFLTIKFKSRIFQLGTKLSNQNKDPENSFLSIINKSIYKENRILEFETEFFKGVLSCYLEEILQMLIKMLVGQREVW